MGYCMSQRDREFFISKDNFPHMIEAIKKLADNTEKMGGGRYQGGKVLSKHYSWVDMTFKDKSDIKEIFSCWRWEIELDEGGNVCDIYFEGEKLGDDGTLFEAIAPFVEDNSYIEMCGEDNSMWRWVFKNKSVREISPQIVWDYDSL